MALVDRRTRYLVSGKADGKCATAGNELLLRSLWLCIRSSLSLLNAVRDLQGMRMLDNSPIKNGIVSPFGNNTVRAALVSNLPRK